MTRFLLILPVVAACGGPENEIKTLHSEIVVTPPAVDFGQVPALRTLDMYVSIDNAGQRTLEATLSLQGADPGMFSLPIETVEIPRDDIPLTLPITFAPETYLPYSAELVVESNDPDKPTVIVPLTGEGIYVPTPDICADPMVLDFGDVAPGDSAQSVIYVENCGDSILELGEMEQTGSGAFRIDALTDPSNAQLSEGERQPIVVYYEPTVDTGDNGTLTFPALNDPDETELAVTLIGNGGGTLPFPIAVIDCPGTAAPPEPVDLDGSDSYDPSGLGIQSYNWLLVNKPDGSQAELSTNLVANTSFFADLGGTYTVQLQVMNDAFLPSVPETCVITAVPADDLHVELTWDTTGVDLDLHMLQNTTADIYDTPEDCNWCNKNPDWGAAGSDDDPRLDLDDRSDGPENINILTPADGAYPVYVHYYPGSNTPTTATVKIYVYGVEIHSVSQVLTENQVWEVGQVNWPEGTFGDYPLNLYNSTRTGCQ